MYSDVTKILQRIRDEESLQCKTELTIGDSCSNRSRRISKTDENLEKRTESQRAREPDKREVLNWLS